VQQLLDLGENLEKCGVRRMVEGTHGTGRAQKIVWVMTSVNKRVAAVNKVTAQSS